MSPSPLPDLSAASAQYADVLGARVGAPQDEPDHGVTVVFIELPNTKIELLYPLGEDSPIRVSLKRPSGGVHHICYEVDDIIAARDRLRERGAASLARASRRSARMASRCCSCIPRFQRHLIELEQA